MDGWMDRWRDGGMDGWMIEMEVGRLFEEDVRLGYYIIRCVGEGEGLERKGGDWEGDWKEEGWKGGKRGRGRQDHVS